MYFDVVASTGQVNTPSGSYRTVKEWIRQAYIDRFSNILEVGCSNGFISIELARYVGATVTGIDLNQASVEAATRNIDQSVLSRVNFLCADAGDLTFPDNHFSHVVIGGHLPFVLGNADRLLHIREAIRVLRPWGYVVTAMYYYHRTPPSDFIEKFNQAFDTHLSSGHDERYWYRLFDQAQLSLEFETTCDISSPSRTRQDEYLAAFSAGDRELWESRVSLLVENGNYLRYFVRVYRKLASDKTLIQVPRGGIYSEGRMVSGTSC